MHGIAALLAAAAVGHLLARLLRVHAIPVLLLAGLALAFLAGPPAAILEDALVLGAAFLLFVTGLELDPQRARAQRRVVLRVGIVQFVVLAALGFGTARLLGFPFIDATYLALALTASSTLVGIRLLQRRRQMFEPFGRLVIGVLLLQDLLVLLSIPLVTEATRDVVAALVTGVGIAALGLLAILVRRWGGPVLLRFADDEELVLLGALAILFAFLGAGDLIGLPIVVGAFLAGVGLSRFPVNGIVRAEVAPIGDFFNAIFFVALGALVRLPTAVEIGQAAVLALLVIIATPLLVAWVAEIAGFSARPSIEAGLLLSQTSEISLVIGLAGMIQGHIGSDTFVVIALVTLVTMLLTPALATDPVAWWLMRIHPYRRRPSPSPPAGHVLLLGTGATGMPLLEDLITAGCDIVVIDDDPGVIKQLAEAEVHAIRGDASDPEVLRAAGAHRARVVSSTIRRPRDNAALLELTPDVPVLIRVFDQEDADWVRENGGTPIMYSEATAEALMEWFAENQQGLEQDVEGRIRGWGSSSEPHGEEAFMS